MPEGTCPVQWLGQQAVVTLPEYLDRSNADRVREQLLLVINRGAVVLIADLAATVSCDYSGADALARAYQRAAASGTELELVVIADVVRRVVSLSGLDRVVSVYPTLEAAIAGADRPEVPGEPATEATSAAVPGPAVAVRAAAQRADRAEEMLDWAVSSIFDVSMTLQAAADLPRDFLAQRITDAAGRLDDVVRQIRDHVFAERGHQTQRDLAWRPPPDLDEYFERAANRAALLHQRVVQTAHAVHSAAADTSALLDHRADLLGRPGRIDYPTEIKQWRDLADQAAQIAERWEQYP
jgi:anti-sigma B factor antagonist